MLRLRTQLFCGISRRAKWKHWLRDNYRDLHDKLQETLRNSSCHQNAAVMKQIHNEIYKRGGGDKFEVFIKDAYPELIDGTRIPNPQMPSPSRQYKVVERSKEPQVPITELNKHGVFKDYKPNILMFPQKKIIANKSHSQLEEQVRSFIKNKAGVDYVIIEDRAYIEYFSPAYAAYANKIDKKKREIYQYKLKNGLL